MTEFQPSRREVIRLLAVSGGALGAGALLHAPGRSIKTVSRTRVLMGTVVNVTLGAEDHRLANQAAEDCLCRMADLEDLLTRFRPQSQLCQLNRSGRVAAAAPELVDLLTTAQQLFAASGGAFDVTVEPLLRAYRWAQHSNTLPSAEEVRDARALVGNDRLHVDGNEVVLTEPGMAVTLDGIAKGYIVDQGVESLRRCGFGDVLVEAGGDLRAAGRREDGQPWKIGIQAPRTDALLGRLAITNGAAATSGDYQQWFSQDLERHHVVDPRTGESSRWLASATVLAPTVMLADALATTLMVLEQNEGDALLAAISGVEALRVTKRGEVIQSAGLSWFSLNQS